MQIMNQAVLLATGLTKRFTEGRLDVTVLQGVDLTVRAGETVAIVGASGSGKSTLLHLLGGLDAPSSGSVQLMGQAMAGLNASQQGDLRNKHLGGAAIDVFDAEPLGAHADLQDCPNLLLTPHISGVSAESNERVSFLIAEKVLEVLH